MNIRAFGKDLLERVVATFVAGFLGAVSLDWASITNLGWKAWLVTGAVAGGVSVVKGLAAKFIGDKDTASLVPGLVSRLLGKGSAAPAPETPSV